MLNTVTQGTPQTTALPAGHVLSVTADALSNGRVFPFADRLGDTPGLFAVDAGDTLQLGPNAAAARYQIEALAGSLTYSDAPADFEAPDESAKGAIGAYDETADGTVALLAAAREDRVVQIVVHVTAVFADGTGTQPTLLIGQTGDTDAFAAAAIFTDAADESKIVLIGTLDADKALLLTQVAATGNGTGAYTVAVIASPLA